MRYAALLALLLSACIRQPSTSPSPIPSAPPSAVPSTSPAAACGEDWHARVRRPARFTEVARCVTFTAVVRAVKAEADGDLHVQLMLPTGELLNARNMNAQHGTLVMEIEPWEHGARTRSADPTRVNNHAPAPYCPAQCSPQAGDRLRVTSAILTDNEPGHGWNEAHSPSDVVVLGHGAPPEGDVPADPTEPD